MGLRWPFAERRGAEEPLWRGRDKVMARQRPICACARPAKLGFKEPLVLILGQPPRTADVSVTVLHQDQLMTQGVHALPNLMRMEDKAG